MSKPEELPEMKYRFLGRSGLQVSAIPLGGWLTYGGHVDREGTYACMKAAYDSGINFFDCAEVYAEGESERVMGEAIKKYGWKRNDLVIATKIYWGTTNSDKKINNVGLSRKHIIEGIEASLERLQLSYVDLVFAHRPDRRTPMEETVRAFNHLINTGKALYWGASEWSPGEIAQAWRYADKLGLIGPLMEQARYNMLERHKVENDFAHLYREHGLGLTAFFPLRFAQTKVEFVAGYWSGQEKSKAWYLKQSVLALAWVLANPNVSSAITGASNPQQVYENIEAIAAYKKLTPEILAEIDEILNNKPPVIVQRF
ncbi:NADP-dependent oxidoreductase domain-containing protein [Cercophora newfieldiana]|uniref:NADP-dependent oxidoreductase domain-containing protein n=1 Tax=Cercophora newfieldiana TaxID=92897 RepID=A0AA39YK21_9PEZI|nr:NADP-dependent oxidoreductase domain-containing protein [Cercophora newfieldiana]